MGQQTKIDLDHERPLEADGGLAAMTAPTAAARLPVPVPDDVDASGADSFPASDPPSWWAGH